MAVVGVFGVKRAAPGGAIQTIGHRLIKDHAAWLNEL